MADELQSKEIDELLNKAIKSEESDTVPALPQTEKEIKVSPERVFKVAKKQVKKYPVDYVSPVIKSCSVILDPEKDIEGSNGMVVVRRLENL